MADPTKDFEDFAADYGRQVNAEFTRAHALSRILADPNHLPEPNDDGSVTFRFHRGGEAS